MIGCFDEEIGPLMILGSWLDFMFYLGFKFKAFFVTIL